MVSTETRNIVTHTGTLTQANGTKVEQNHSTEQWNKTLNSVDHPGWRKAIRNDLVNNVGGPFDLTDLGRSRYLSSSVDIRTSTSDLFGVGRFQGSFIDGGFPAYPSTSKLDPADYAAEAYNRMKPTKPSFNALNFIVELRDLPGMMRERFTRDLRGGAGKHVEVQFGWLPLLSDLRKLVNLQQTAQKRLTWLIENNGKPVRRRTTLVETSTRTGYTTVPGVGHLPSLPNVTVYKSPIGFEWHDEYTHVWASARFRYWLPKGPRNIEWTKEMLDRLYGRGVTPEVIYNAIPWSWLVDWFSNVGDVLANLDAGVADRLAADYFYVMAHSIRMRTREVNVIYQDPRSLQRFNITTTSNAYFIQKRRVVGDPFGFNTSETSLTSMQLSILGALGLSRLR